jgi:hypothetical protein
MMVYGSHFENAFALTRDFFCYFEISYLQHNGSGFYYVDNTRDENDEGVIDEKCESANRAAEEERACIAHKNLSGVEIVNEEAEAAAENSAGKVECALIHKRSGRKREKYAYNCSNA